MTSIPSSKIQEIAFWDTNTLHFVDVYLQHAKKKGFFPYSDPTISQSKADVRSATNDNVKRAYENGSAALAFCRKKDLRISYSPVSELELIVGRARGKALLTAAKENMPDRMWSRFRDEDINRRLTPADLAMTASRVDDLASRLRNLDINVIEGAESRVTETWALARKLLSVVYMSVNDALIYASALLERARYVVTFDAYLRKTINRCCRGNESVRDSITDVLGGEISLPQSPTAKCLKKYRTSYL